MWHICIDQACYMLRCLPAQHSTYIVHLCIQHVLISVTPTVNNVIQIGENYFLKVVESEYLFMIYNTHNSYYDNTI